MCVLAESLASLDSEVSNPKKFKLRHGFERDPERDANEIQKERKQASGRHWPIPFEAVLRCKDTSLSKPRCP